MVSPSTLTAHLSQATLAISSLPQLSQLLMDEIERCLLQKICNLGREMCSSLGGIWFVDLDRCIARWEGCVLYVCSHYKCLLFSHHRRNFQIVFDDDFTLGCSAFRSDHKTPRDGITVRYSLETPLFDWIRDVIRTVLWCNLQDMFDFFLFFSKDRDTDDAW